jgi:hypothetical protein
VRSLALAALVAASLTTVACPSAPAPLWPGDIGPPVTATLCLSAFPAWDPDGGASRAHDLALYPPFHEIRSDFLWTRIETTPGVYDFSGLDGMVADLEASGFRPLGILDYNNALYEGPDGGSWDGGSDTLAVTDPSHYVDFAVATVTHYGPGVDYEIWNEPNNAFSFWQSFSVTGKSPDPAGYAALVAAAAPAIRAACPACHLFAGAIDYQGQDLGDVFLQGMLAAQPSLWTLFDAVSYHAYPDYVPIAPPDFAGIDGSATSATPEVPLVQMASNLRAEVQQVGGPIGFPLAMTQDGWPTGTGWVTLDQQADYLVEAALLSFSAGDLTTCFYTLQDGTNAEDPESNFGMYLDDWSPKPAVGALSAMVEALGDTAFEMDRGSELGLQPQEHALSFVAADRRTTALWSDAPRADGGLPDSGPGRTIAVPAHPDVATTTFESLDGGVLAVAPGDAGIIVTLQLDPLFLIEERWLAEAKRGK